MSKASENDFNAVREILHRLKHRDIFADKAYSNEDMQQFLEKELGIRVLHRSN